MGSFLSSIAGTNREPTLTQKTAVLQSLKLNIGIFTYGTRGDLQPYVGLALGLMKNGHRVTISATEDFREFVEAYGITFQPLWGNAEQMMHAPEGQRILQTENALKLMKYYFRVLHDNRDALRKSYFEAISKVDAIIANSMTLPIVSAIAEKQQKKMVLTYFMPPIVPTGEFPLADFDFFNFPFYNRLTYKLAQALFWTFTKKDVHEYRTMLGLPILKENLLAHVDRQKMPDLYCFSQYLIPQPKDWESHHQITGFINISAEQRNNNSSEQPSRDLRDWLTRGEKPIYIGFGSNGIGNPGKISQIIVDLLSKTKYRILFCTGWSDFPQLPSHDQLYVAKYCNHEAVFPHCRLGIFHGGAGTLATLLRHQLPVIVVSYYTDQPSWGKMVERKEVGRHIPHKKLTGERLMAAIEYCANPTVRDNAARLGRQIAAEKGLENTIQIIEAYLQPESEKVKHENA